MCLYSVFCSWVCGLVQTWNELTAQLLFEFSKCTLDKYALQVVLMDEVEPFCYVHNYLQIFIQSIWPPNIEQDQKIQHCEVRIPGNQLELDAIKFGEIFSTLSFSQHYVLFVKRIAYQICWGDCLCEIFQVFYPPPNPQTSMLELWAAPCKLDHRK